MAAVLSAREGRVAAVIAVVTFVNGINGYVAEKIFNLGADVFIISKVTPVVTNVDQLLEGQKRKDLTMEDYHAVAESCHHSLGSALTDCAGSGGGVGDADEGPAT